MLDDMFSIEIAKYIKSFGHALFKCIWYCNPKYDLSNGLRPLNNYVAVLQFANDIKGYKEVDIYVEHLRLIACIGCCFVPKLTN